MTLADNRLCCTKLSQASYVSLDIYKTKQNGAFMYCFESQIAVHLENVTAHQA